MTPTENPASTSPTGDGRTAGRDRARRTTQSSRTETHSRFGADRRQSGSYPETGFREISSKPTSGPEQRPVLPVTRVRSLVSSKLDWIMNFASLIVCAQCVSRDWLAIEKDCLNRVICGNTREGIFLEQEQVSSLANLDGA